MALVGETVVRGVLRSGASGRVRQPDWARAVREALHAGRIKEASLCLQVWGYAETRPLGRCRFW